MHSINKPWNQTLSLQCHAFFYFSTINPKYSSLKKNRTFHFIHNHKSLSKHFCYYSKRCRPSIPCRLQKYLLVWGGNCLIMLRAFFGFFLFLECTTVKSKQLVFFFICTFVFILYLEEIWYFSKTSLTWWFHFKIKLTCSHWIIIIYACFIFCCNIFGMHFFQSYE